MIVRTWRAAIITVVLALTGAGAAVWHFVADQAPHVAATLAPVIASVTSPDATPSPTATPAVVVAYTTLSPTDTPTPTAPPPPSFQPITTTQPTPTTAPAATCPATFTTDAQGYCHAPQAPAPGFGSMSSQDQTALCGAAYNNLILDANYDIADETYYPQYASYYANTARQWQLIATAIQTVCNAPHTPIDPQFCTTATGWLNAGLQSHLDAAPSAWNTQWEAIYRSIIGLWAEVCA